MITNRKSIPLITIGITCFNAKDTITRAINSAIAQTYQKIEILIVDDCSEDTSALVISDLIKNISFARLICHDINRGTGAARETIIKNARGEYIVFFDDDDESFPQRVETQYKRLSDYETTSGAQLIACYASGVRIYPNGYEKKLMVIGMNPVIPHGSAVADYLLFYRKVKGWCYGGTPTCALMARKKVFEDVGGFDPAFRRVEDIDFAVRLSLSGGHFIGCPDPLLIQYSTETNDKSYERNLNAEIQIADKHKGYLKSIGRYNYARNWPMLRYYHFRRKYGRFAIIFFKLFVQHPILVTLHFLQTAPRRFVHEIRASRRKA